MNPRQRAFLAREYRSLWKDHGVSDDLLPLDTQPQPKPTQDHNGAPLTIDDLRELALKCTLCDRHQTRRQLVYGSGSFRASLLFLGDSPSRWDDERGLPFLGPEGDLLTKIIAAMGLNREEVYLTHLLKCHKEDKGSLELEVDRCSSHLRKQIALINPRIVVTLGETATRAVLSVPDSLIQLRGTFHPFPGSGSTFVMPTYAPGYLLDHPEAKRAVWEDMKRVKMRLASS